MIAREMLDEFVKRVREAGGTNVESVILFGSAVSGDFHPGLSNFNLLCILGATSFSALQALAPAAKWWDKQKQPPPLCMTRQELERSTDVFTIELLDIKQHHRILYGTDVLSGLQIPMDLHRVQVEYELREKLMLLRQHVMMADGKDSRLWDVLMHSVPSFSTLFRHALIALGDSSTTGRRESSEALSKRLGLDTSPLLHVLDVREKKIDRSKWDVRDLAARYLTAVEQVTEAVDAAFDKGKPPRA